MKNMRKNKFAVLALTLPMLIACGSKKDDPTPPIDRTPLSVSAGITDFTPPAAGGRASTDVTWNQGDAIGIYTLTTGTDVVSEGVSNLKYTNTAANATTATFVPTDVANTAYYPDNGSKVDVLAYYPYSTGAAGEAPDPSSMQIQVDVTNQTTLSAIDFMTAEKVTGKSKDAPEVALNFKHRLTKLNITIEKHPAATEIDLAAAKLTLAGTAGTAVYDVYNQDFASKGDKKEISIPVTAGADQSEATAIAIPTAANSGVTFIVDINGEKTETLLTEGTALESGKEISLTITLKTSVGSITIDEIKDWESGSTGTGGFEY